MRLIPDKITLPGELPPLSRVRLLNLLQRSLSLCHLTIINGRTGTGKTMLAADFAQHCGRHVAWYRVHASDSDPRVFFRYLIASIRKQRSGFGTMWDSAFEQNLTEANMARLAESFIHELSEVPGEPLLIVIDDLHLVYDAGWVTPFFSRLAPLLPMDVHLMILCRSLPPTPQGRMRSKQTLSIIDEAMLNFTLEETKMLAAIYGLAESEASGLFKQSGGRAARLDSIAKSQSSPGTDRINFQQKVFV